MGIPSGVLTQVLTTHSLNANFGDYAAPCFPSHGGAPPALSDCTFSLRAAMINLFVSKASPMFTIISLH